MVYSRGRGQLLTTDFILSLAIFVAILFASMSLWTSVDTQIRDAESRRDMQSIATYVSEALVRNAGYPKNWTNNTVVMIGLAGEEHILDIGKFLSMKKINYNKARTMMRLGNYDFRIWITDDAGYDLTSGIVRSPVAVLANSSQGLEYVKMLNNSVVVWDIYYNINSVDVNKLTARNKYPYGNALSAFVVLTANQSSYRTIIIEDAGLTNESVGDLSDLVNFVRRGGILIYTDPTVPWDKPLIANNFSMSFLDCSPSCTTRSRVLNVNSHVLNTTKNTGPFADKIDFTHLATHKRDVFRDTTKADVELHVIANTSSTRAQIAWWDHGLGRVYYIEDTRGQYSYYLGVPISSWFTEEPYTYRLNIVGENLSYGYAPSNQSDLVSIRRMVILSGFEREVANLNLVVWR